MVKIEIIQVGHLGKFHLNNWKIEWCQLVWFCDTAEDIKK